MCWGSPFSGNRGFRPGYGVQRGPSAGNGGVGGGQVVPLPGNGGDSGVSGPEMEFQVGLEAQKWWIRGFPVPGNRGSRGSWCQKIEVQEGPSAQEWGFMEVLVPDKGVQKSPSPGEGDAGRSQYPGMGVQGGSRAQEGGCRVF